MSPLKILSLISSLLISIVSVAQSGDSVQWALVKIPVVCIRKDKSHTSEMTSQAIMGTPLQILEDDDEWIRIKAPDNYEGYVNISGLSRKSAPEMADWRSSSRLVSVSRSESKVYSTPGDKSARNVVSELVLSSIVNGIQDNSNMVEIKLPDGRKGYVDSNAVIPIEKWATRKLDIDSVVDTAYWLLGTPYLWGACSTKSVDCSGLVRVAYFDRAILTLRDARQQIEIGGRIAPADTSKLKRGDLLFFSNTPDGRISHVAIYDSDGKYIHSSGLVKVNRMDQDDPDFGKRYYRGASRIQGMEDTDGITRIFNHPWYFNTHK